MDSKFQLVADRLVKQGATKKAQLENGGGAVRSLELNNVRKGDIVTIPSDWRDNIYESPIRGSEASAEYILLNVKRGTGEAVVQFYPSSFFKVRNEVRTINTNGVKSYELTGKQKPSSGTVVDFVQNYSDLNEAIDALVDKPFKVKDLVAFQTFRYGTEIPQNTTVPVYDFVNA
jgi:hypothetical protein